MVDEEQDHSGPEQEEDEDREGVGDRGRSGAIEDRGDHEEDEGGADRVAGVETGPLRVDHVGEEKAGEDQGVGDLHGDRDLALP